MDVARSASAGSGLSSKIDYESFLAFDGDQNPTMDEAFADFLEKKAHVNLVFLKDFEKHAMVWNLKRFQKWFAHSKATVARRFGVDFCDKYKLQIIRLGTLFLFLEGTPLQVGSDGKVDYDSFDQEAWTDFQSFERRGIKEQWELAFHELLQTFIELHHGSIASRKDPSTYRPSKITSPEDSDSKVSGLSAYVSPNDPNQNPKHIDDLPYDKQGPAACREE